MNVSCEPLKLCRAISRCILQRPSFLSRVPCITAKGKIYAEGPPTDQQIDEIRSKFDKFDKDGSGEIDAKELSALIKQVTGQEFDTDELDNAMSEMDPDKSGNVSWAEFKKWFFDEDAKEEKTASSTPAPSNGNGKDDGEVSGANEGVYDNKIN